MSEPIKVKSFDGKSSQLLKESMILKINFGCVTTKLKFYFCKVDTPIIGIDLLRDPRLKLSINTKTNTFQIDKHSLQTREDENLSKDELDLRMNEKKKGDKMRIDDKKTNWVRIIKDTTLRSNRVTDILVEMDTLPSNTRKQAFLSLFDEDTDHFFIPSLIIWNVEKKIILPIENKTTDEIKLKKGAKLGEIKACSESPSHRSVMTFDADDIREALRPSKRSPTCNAVSGEIDEPLEPETSKESAENVSDAAAAAEPQQQITEADPDVRRSRRKSVDAEATIPPEKPVNHQKT